MKRHPALIPLSHDHHDALVAGRRLRRGADGPDPQAAAAFLDFYATETVRHFREEEEVLFPKVNDRDEATALVTTVLLEHQRLHALTARLAAQLASGALDGGLMRNVGELLETHVRREERELFPLIERLLTDEELSSR